MDESQFVVLGRITGAHGIRGWVKVYSETRPRDGILGYSPWFLRRNGQWVPFEVSEGRLQGKGLVAQLEGCGDREAAIALKGAEIAIPRARLPEPEAGEYYWADLIGLAVETTSGVSLGRVDHLLETGANDVLVVRGDQERLVPFVPDQVVVEVDLKGGRLVVDWDPDF